MKEPNITELENRKTKLSGIAYRNIPNTELERKLISLSYMSGNHYDLNLEEIFDLICLN